MEPKIRFKGFEGEWKSKAFQESFVPLKKNSLSRAYLTDDGEIANVHYGDVLIKYSECVDTSVDKLTYILDNEIGKNLVKNGALKRGDIIFADAAEDNSVGKCSELICEDNELIVSGLHTIACRPQIDVAERYLGYYLNSPAYHNQLLPHIQGTKISSISRKAINTTSVVIPTQKKEQQTIAFYFTSLDSQISASTSRLASLKQMKAASLQAMFPQEGETVPKVRFKGFEGKWKKVKFGTLLKECIDKSTSEDEDILLSSAINGVFLNSELFGHQRGRSNIGYRKIRKNMLILSAQNLHLGNANVNLRFEHGLVSPAYKIYDLYNVIPEFMYHWIKREETKKFFLDATTAGASLCRKNIVWTDLYKQKILLPESYAEQQAIANYFASLDHQITLQTQRLEKLKQMKAACLDKMFV